MVGDDLVVDGRRLHMETTSDVLPILEVGEHFIKSSRLGL